MVSLAFHNSQNYVKTNTCRSSVLFSMPPRSPQRRHHTKETCPVCRQAITTKKKADGKMGSKGIFALELKLMTAKKKGKQPVRAR